MRRKKELITNTENRETIEITEVKRTIKEKLRNPFTLMMKIV